MRSRKRWHDTYPEVNPFQLPQTITKELKAIAASNDINTERRVRYLWVYVSEDSLEDGPGPEGRLSLDEWLSIIDETAAWGVECMVISVGAALGEHPEVVDMCLWAQETHGMLAGIHLYCPSVASEDLLLLARLDPKKTHFFLEGESAGVAKRIQEMGFPVYPALGEDKEVVSPECHLPKKMTCVGASGTMYTCGLVLGEKTFRLGNFFERKLDHVINDHSLPHVIPEGLPKSGHRCNGCPPLIIERMRDQRT